MDQPTVVDPPADDVARCFQYTSSCEDQSRLAPTTDDRVAEKRPMAVEPSSTKVIPVGTAVDPSMGQGSSSHAPKHCRLVRIVDDDNEEDETAPSLVRRPHRRPNVVPSDAGPVTSDPRAAHIKPIRPGGTEAAVAAGRTRRRFFTAAHWSSDL